MKTFLNVGILPEMVDELKTFPIGSTIKIQCAMAYCPGDFQLHLTCQELGYVSSVKLVVR
jgi:hypothetical protein